MNFTITKKLTLLVTLVVMITASVLGVSVNREYDKLFTQQELKNMGEQTSEATIRILTVLERMKEDVLFLSTTPPIHGVIRARDNNGLDIYGGSSEVAWKKRLEIIFDSFLKSKPHYIKSRYIGISDSGKELVRVDKHSGHLKRYGFKDLQSKSHRPYFKKGISLRMGEVHLTDVNYNREFGELTTPLTLVMRAVTPVYGNDGRVFGLIVLTLDANYIFSKYLTVDKNAYGITRYITNSKGDFLSMNNNVDAKVIDTSIPQSSLSSYQEWDGFFKDVEQKEIAKKVSSNSENIALYAKKLFYDVKDKDKFIVLTEEKPYKLVVSQANHVKKYNLFLAMLLLIPAALITVVFSNRFTRPLKDITKSLSDFRQNRFADIPVVSTNDEIGALATSFREMINELNSAQEQLVQSEKMASIGQLAAGVAHEINNPVGFIGSNINTLQTYCDDLVDVIKEYEKLDEYLKTNHSSWDSVNQLKDKVDLEYIKEDLGKLIAESLDGVKRVKGIVQDLKDFSHVDESEWQYASLHHGLESTLNIVNNEIKYKAEVNKYYGKIPDIECLASQLNQVFMNLLVNAAHAIEKQGIISITTGCPDGKWVFVSISDTGSGIEKSKLSKIFDPFFTTKPIGQGTGLGLSLSYKIIEKHNGRIEVDSTEGVGTKFTIWLPVNHKNQEDLNDYAA